MITEALLCLALNAYHEARDQGYDGMAAVAIVTLNRAKQNPDKVCEVVFKPYQFSWANRLTTTSAALRIQRAPEYLPKETEAWEAAKVVAWQALNGLLDSEIVANVGSSDHYLNPNKATDFSWRDQLTLVAVVGDHEFYSSGRSY